MTLLPCFWSRKNNRLYSLSSYLIQALKLDAHRAFSAHGVRVFTSAYISQRYDIVMNFYL